MWPSPTPAYTDTSTVQVPGPYRPQQALAASIAPTLNTHVGTPLACFPTSASWGLVLAPPHNRQAHQVCHCYPTGCFCRGMAHCLPKAVQHPRLTWKRSIQKETLFPWILAAALLFGLSDCHFGIIRLQRCHRWSASFPPFMPYLSLACVQLELL